MNIGELKHLIEEAERLWDVTDKTEVRLAYQPNYPLEARVAGLRARAEVMDAMVDYVMDEKQYDRDEAEKLVEAEHGPGSLEDQDIVYITAGNDLGYGMRAAWS